MSNESSYTDEMYNEEEFKILWQENAELKAQLAGKEATFKAVHDKLHDVINQAETEVASLQIELSKIKSLLSNTLEENATLKELLHNSNIELAELKGKFSELIAPGEK